MMKIEIHDSNTCAHNHNPESSTPPPYISSEKYVIKEGNQQLNQHVNNTEKWKMKKTTAKPSDTESLMFCFFSFSQSFGNEQQARTFNTTDEQLNTIVSITLPRLFALTLRNFPRRYNIRFFLFFFDIFDDSAHIFDNSHKHTGKSLAVRHAFTSAAVPYGCVCVCTRCRRLAAPRRQYRAMCEWAANVKIVYWTTKSCHFFLSQTNEWNE